MKCGLFEITGQLTRTGFLKVNTVRPPILLGDGTVGTGGDISSVLIMKVHMQVHVHAFVNVRRSSYYIAEDYLCGWIHFLQLIN